MKGHSLRLLALCSVPLVGACADEGVVGLGGPAVEIEVAPLTLPGVTDVCYGIYVQNGSGQVVDALNNICSTQYGNNGGGDISYVVPCDASAGNEVHTVTLVLEGFKTTATGTNWADETQYKNPCGWNTSGPLVGSNPVTTPSETSAPTPPGNDGNVNYDGTICQRTFTCQENEDVAVVFNLTVMRDADQGFFDVAVNFEDIFCSAKFDSCYDGDAPIELLFGDDTDTDTNNAAGDAVGDEPGRDKTGVFAMACTAGAGANITTDILMSKVIVNCPAPTGSFSLPLSGLTPPTGNQYVTVDADGDTQVDDKVQYAIYAGSESLDCGQDGPCNKAYYNIAINLEDLPEGCTLSLQATAQDLNKPAFTGGTVTTMATSGTTYPFVQVNGANLKQTECVQDGLNDGGSVSTFFGSSMDGGIKPTLMCDHSKNGNGAEAITTAAAASAAYAEMLYATKETAREVIALADVGKFIRYELKDPCTNTAYSPVRVQKDMYNSYKVINTALLTGTARVTALASNDIKIDNVDVALTDYVQYYIGRESDAAGVSEVIGTFKGTQAAVEIAKGGSLNFTYNKDTFTTNDRILVATTILDEAKVSEALSAVRAEKLDLNATLAF